MWDFISSIPEKALPFYLFVLPLLHDRGPVHQRRQRPPHRPGAAEGAADHQAGGGVNAKENVRAENLICKTLLRLKNS